MNLFRRRSHRSALLLDPLYDVPFSFLKPEPPTRLMRIPYFKAKTGFVEHNRSNRRALLLALLFVIPISFLKARPSTQSVGTPDHQPKMGAVQASVEMYEASPEGPEVGERSSMLGPGQETATPTPEIVPAGAEEILEQTQEPLSGGDTNSISPTPIVNQDLLEQPSPTDPTSTPDALRFVFPVSVPQPVSAWRPPLYPVPWEPTPYDHFYFARPIAADEVNWPLPDYRYGGVFWKDVVHTGVDIPVPSGTPILAAGEGQVTWTGYGLLWGRYDEQDPYGLAVVVRHEFGYEGERLFTIYAHMSQINVVKGDRVETGDVLGLSGATGSVTGPHLHFEVRLGKSNFHLSRNPELWIAPPQGWGVVAARVMNDSGSFLRRQAIKLRNNDTGQNWEVDTYGEGSANSDRFYQENMVIGDLPAGNYTVWIEYDGRQFEQDIQVKPGLVTYFRFYGEKGFSLKPPKEPESSFSPPDGE